jgi:mannose-6-phosphate isomerase-like protein (cupin superfamily)
VDKQKRSKNRHLDGFLIQYYMMQRKSVKKPWGGFEEFTENEPSTVKILTILPGQEISLQSHKNRSEFWKVIKGAPTIIIGDKEITAKEDEEFSIPKGEEHRIEAKAGDTETQILEISFGKFDEEDIERIDDKYGRV